MWTEAEFRALMDQASSDVIAANVAVIEEVCGKKPVKKAKKTMPPALTNTKGRPKLIEFTLLELLPAANQWERMDRWAKMAFKRRLATEIKAITGWKWAPYSKAKVTVIRRLQRQRGGASLDGDGMKYSCKALLDALQGPPRNDYGVGIIADDGPRVIGKDGPELIEQSGSTKTETIVEIRACESKI